MPANPEEGTSAATTMTLVQRRLSVRRKKKSLIRLICSVDEALAGTFNLDTPLTPYAHAQNIRRIEARFVAPSSEESAQIQTTLAALLAQGIALHSAHERTGADT